MSLLLEMSFGTVVYHLIDAIVDQLKPAITSSNTPIAFSALLREMQSGPSTRTRWPLWPPFPNSTPASLPFSNTCASSSGLGYLVILSFTNSTASSMPLPRTSPMNLLFCPILLN